MERIEIQTASTIDSIRKQLAQANARAEEAERKLDERDKNHTLLYNQLNTSKVNYNDLLIKY